MKGLAEGRRGTAGTLAHIVEAPGSSRDRGDTNLLLFKPLSASFYLGPGGAREKRHSFCSFAGLRFLSPFPSPLRF